MANKKSTRTAEPKLKPTVRHALTNIYVILMFSVFPLFLSSYYSSARRDKFYILLILTAVIGIPVGILSIVDACTKYNTYNTALNIYRDPFKLSVTDIGIFAFFGISVISMQLSGNSLHSFIGLSEGSNGRNMGVLTLFALLVCYMIVSRFFYYKRYIFYCLFAGISIVSLLAILNYYYIDPLGLFKAYEGSSNYELVLNDFTSTIGNKNYLSALICVSLPFSFGMGISTENRIMRIVSYISTGIQFIGLLVATSDGGFLGCFVAFAVILVVISRDKLKLSRFFFGLFIMMASAKLLWIFDYLMKGKSKGYTSFSQTFIYSNYVYAAMVMFLVLAFLFGFFERRLPGLLPKGVFIGVLSAVCLAALAVIALVIYFTFINPGVKLAGLEKFFRFDEYWGTHRGYFWIRTFDVFKNLSWQQMLFGAGPESYYSQFSPYFDELMHRFGDSSTNAAHNVYLNYLITQGVLGLGAYLTFIGAAVVRGIRSAKDSPLALLCVGVIVAYAAQDFVNIANPVNTPWFFIFIALCESTHLRANSTPVLRASNF